MTKPDERSDSRLLLEAYELVGVVIDRYLDRSDFFDKKSGNTHSKEEKEAWAAKASRESDKIFPFDNIRTEILKQLILALDDGMGMVALVDQNDDRNRI